MRHASAIALALTLLAGCKLTNHPPALAPLADVAVHVGETVQFDLTAEDGDGDALHFAMRFDEAFPPEGATLTPTSKNAARFRWSPLISDALGTGRRYRVHFVVEDGFGGSDSADVVITVFREGGVPEFLNPHGYVLDLSEREYIGFTVEVKDDDSASVTIGMAHPIDGALLERRDEKTADFYWRPTPEQVAAQLFYTVVFSADDGEHPAVLYDVGIVLQNAGAGTDCPGTPPSILHVPPGDHWQAGDLVLEATFTDAQSVVRYPTLQYTLGDAPGAPAGSVAFEALGEGRYAATVPTHTLPSSAAVLVRYSLTAEDNDDMAATRCDHAARAPKEGTYAVAWYGTASGLACLDDPAEPDDAAAPALTPGQPMERRLCPGDTDRVSLPLDGSTPRALVATFTGAPGDLELALLDATGAPLALASTSLGGTRLELPAALAPGAYVATVSTPGSDPLSYRLDLVDTGAACPPDALEPNDDPSSAPTLAEGSYADLVLCPGEIDAYRLAVAPGQNVAAQIHFRQQVGDLDLYVLDPGSLQVLAAAETANDDERVFLPAPGLPEVLVAVLGFQGAGNAYALDLRTGDDAELCQEDLFSPNASPIEAAPLIEGTFSDLVLCPGNEDWYSLGLNGGETLELGFETATPPDLLSTFAQSPASEAVSLPCQATDKGLTCQLAITAPGDWRFGLASSAGLVAYALTAWATEPPGPCVDDRLEPNDVAGKSDPLPPGITSHLKICDDNPDWFHVDLDAFQPLTVYALYLPERGAVQLELRAADGSVVATSTPANGAAVLEASAPAAGRFHVVVTAPAAANLFYDLIVELP